MSINVSNSFNKDIHTIVDMYEEIYLILQNEETYESILELLSETELVVLEDVSNLELEYFKRSEITDEFYKNDLGKLATVISIAKTFFYNDRERFDKLSTLRYRGLALISLEGLESNIKTLEYLMKYLPMKIDKFFNLVKSSKLMPYQLQDVCNIYMMAQRLSTDPNLYKSFKQIVRSKDFIGLYLLSTSMINDKDKDLENLLDMVMQNNNEGQITIDLDKYGRNTLESLRERYKEKLKSSFLEDRNNKPEDDNEIKIKEEPEVNIPKSIRINSFDKAELMKDNKFLLFKSTEINLTNYWGNITVRNVSEINKDIDFSKYDSVLLLTRKIKHSDYYKLRSVCNNKILFISSTNRNAMIEEIFDKF